MSYKKLGVSPKEFKEHTGDKENPHEVTKEQVGLGNVKDEEQATKEEFEEHIDKRATEEVAGHVRLSNTVNSQSSVSDGVAATPRAVKTTYDYIDEHAPTMATKSRAGHVIIGDGIEVDDEGVISVEGGGDGNVDEHAKQVATPNKLGHIMVGKGLDIDSEGRLSVPSAPTIYGVEIDEDNSDPFGRVRYIADSTGFEPLYTGDVNVDLGSWGDKFPINKIKIALMKDGEVVEELDKNDHTKTADGRTVDITSGESGDVMVAIPLTYWKLERVGSKLRIYVSEHEIDEDYKAYAHSRDGVVQGDYLYIGAYKGNVQDGKLRSLHDVMSTGDTAIGKIRDYAEANGEGYGQINWATMTLMQIFTVLLTKSTDSQSALGRGYVDGNDNYIKNGGTTKKGLFYGESTGKKQMKFLGIEDFWGNRYEWVDGLVRKDDRVWTNTKNTNYNNDADGYNDVGTASNFNGYFKSVIGTTDSGFFPIASGGSSSTHYCDGYWYNEGHRVACFGGFRSSDLWAGAFQLSVLVSPSSSDAVRGARLLYLKGGN